MSGLDSTAGSINTTISCLIYTQPQFDTKGGAGIFPHAFFLRPQISSARPHSPSCPETSPRRWRPRLCTAHTPAYGRTGTITVTNPRGHFRDSESLNLPTFPSFFTSQLRFLPGLDIIICPTLASWISLLVSTSLELTSLSDLDTYIRLQILTSRISVPSPSFLLFLLIP